MKSLEIKIHVSGEQLQALKVLAGAANADNPAALRKTARAVFNHQLNAMNEAMRACLEGKVGGLDVTGGEETTEETTENK